MKKIFLFLSILVLCFSFLVSCAEEEPENVTYDSINIANDELKGIKRFWHDDAIKVTMEQYSQFFAEELPINTLLDYSRHPRSKHTFYLLKSNSNEFSCIGTYVGLNEKIHEEDVELSNEIYSFYYKYALSPELVFGSDVNVTAVYCFAGMKPGIGYSGGFLPDELDIYFVTNEGDYVLSQFYSTEYLLPANVYRQFAVKSYNDKTIYDGGPRQILDYADDLAKYVFKES